MGDLEITNIFAILTVVLGIFSFVYPKKVSKLIGLNIESFKGFVEVKAVYGGSFIGLGLAALFIDSNSGYDMLGAMWLGTGLARVATFLISKKPIESSQTLFFLLAEVIIGSILIVS